jgi:hypothetical protein
MGALILFVLSFSFLCAVLGAAWIVVQLIKHNPDGARRYIAGDWEKRAESAEAFVKGYGLGFDKGLSYHRPPQHKQDVPRLATPLLSETIESSENTPSNAVKRQKINIGSGVGEEYGYKFMSDGVMWFSDYGTTPTPENVLGILDCADLLQVGRAAQIQGTELFAVRCKCGTVKVSTQKMVQHCSDNCKTLNNLKP